MRENTSVFKGRTIHDFAMITLGSFLTVIGAHFFKFPNNFSFGGVTGLSVMIGYVSTLSPGQANVIINVFLLLVGFVTLGKSFGLKTIYATIVISVGLSLLDIFYPVITPLTGEPFLELLYAVALPGIGAAILFQVNSSGGGTDIIALILKKYFSINIGNALLVADCFIVIASYFVFGVETFLLSTMGMFTKSLVVDNYVYRLNLSKVYNVVCDDPEPVCKFIQKTIHRGATISECEGAFTHQKRYNVMTVLKPHQGNLLQKYLDKTAPNSFITITNTSEIIGKGFHR
ncbi:MAG: hypothetical protein BKP49_03055 [Treponema sp. CETP13]|nr:MAG: hypothetical protein BKP49_03055 [Treponema sp. CETP13]